MLAGSEEKAAGGFISIRKANCWFAFRCKETSWPVVLTVDGLLIVDFGVD